MSEVRSQKSENQVIHLGTPLTLGEFRAFTESYGHETSLNWRNQPVQGLFRIENQEGAILAFQPIVKEHQNFKCACENITPQSKECYAQQIKVNIPGHMQAYAIERLKNGLTCQICIDPCILDEMYHLWSKGIITYGSCCGHNLYEPFVNVDESNIRDMLDMGYVMNHPDRNRLDTFRLKSISFNPLLNTNP